MSSLIESGHKINHRERFVGIEVNFEGKIALITGASSGLGAQFAKTLAESGAGVVLAFLLGIATNDPALYERHYVWLFWVNVALASTLVLWWDTGAIASAQARKAQLQAEVAELQASYDGWVKVGVQQKVLRCNPGNRPCIRVDENAGAFESQGYAGYRVIWGY